MEKELVSLGVSQELITPIVEKEIKAAVVACMGGVDNVIDSIVSTILNQRVNKDNGEPTSSTYHSCTYLEYFFTKQVEQAIKDELEVQMKAASGTIKDAILRSLSKKSAQDQVANAMLSALLGSLKPWSSNINISFEETQLP